MQCVQCLCVCVRAAKRYLSSVLLKGFPDSSVGKKKKNLSAMQKTTPPQPTPDPRHFNPFHINCFPHWSALWKGWLHWFSSNTQQPAKEFELRGALPLFCIMWHHLRVSVVLTCRQSLSEGSSTFTHVAGALLGKTESLSLGLSTVAQTHSLSNMDRTVQSFIS